MIVALLRKIIHILTHLKGYIKIQESKSRVTFVGKNQYFGIKSIVYIRCGSTKEDICMEEHSELFGMMLSYNHGKIHLGKWAKIGPGSCINCVHSIEIGDDTAIADNVTIVDHNFHPINPEDRRYMRHCPHGAEERMPMYSAHAPIIIGKNVMIYNNVRIHKGVTIGDNSIIAANAVVTKSIPANCIAAGVPAKVVKTDIDKTTTPIFPLNK